MLNKATSTILLRPTKSFSFKAYNTIIPGIIRKDLDGCIEEHGYLFANKSYLANAVKDQLNHINFRLPHRKWTKNEVLAVQATHRPAQTLIDKAAYALIKFLRISYDTVSLYSIGYRNESAFLTRVTVLETIAGVPGMVGAFFRHLKSLRQLVPDYGYINTLLAEAENERMHLMTALILKKPGLISRYMIKIGQIGFTIFYSIMYLLCPYFCHRFVGYLEEEAVLTYSTICRLLEEGKLPKFEISAPEAAIQYWGLPKNAMLHDVWLAIRADEAHHRLVNHTFAEESGKQLINSFAPGT